MGNFSDKTYFDILPPDLKREILRFDPKTSLLLCDNVIAFKEICSSGVYGTKLYHKEFSEYRLADYREYLASVVEWNELSWDKYVPESYAIRKGWEKKLIPMIENRPYPNLNSGLGYELLRTAINYEQLHIIKYLVDNSTSFDFDLFAYQIASQGNLEILKYFINKGLVDQRQLNRLLSYQNIKADENQEKRKKFIAVLLYYGATPSYLQPSEQAKLQRLVA